MYLTYVQRNVPTEKPPYDVSYLFIWVLILVNRAKAEKNERAWREAYKPPTLDKNHTKRTDTQGRVGGQGGTTTWASPCPQSSSSPRNSFPNRAKDPEGDTPAWPCDPTCPHFPALHAPLQPPALNWNS